MSDNKEIRVAIAGLGNCAAALIQGIEFYRNIDQKDMYQAGLMNPEVAGYLPRHIKIVAVFDVSTTKLGKDVSEAIYELPNCGAIIVPKEKMPKLGVIVQPGPISDGVAPHMRESFRVYDEAEVKPVDLVKTLKDAKAEILVNFLPVGSYKASRIYAQAAIDAGCGFINCIPEFIVSDHVEGDKDWVS